MYIFAVELVIRASFETFGSDDANNKANKRVQKVCYNMTKS